MNKSFFFFVIIISSAFTAILHFLGLMFDWNMVIGEWNVPGWISGIIILFSVFMIYWAVNLNRSTQNKDNSKKED